MKSEPIMDAVTELDDELILDDPAPAMRAAKKKYTTVWAACALLAMALIIGGILLFARDNGGYHKPVALAAALAEPEYPRDKQWEDYYNNATANLPDPAFERRLANRGAADGFRGFFTDITLQLLGEEDTENAVMSPVNIFMATAMLAEISGGETRQEILDALHMDSLETLRGQAHKVWDLVYHDNGIDKVIPANSLWLSQDYPYAEEAVSMLAEQYYASVFQGEMGDPAYDELLRSWLNAQTGGLLKENIDSLQFEPDTVLRLLSTLYLQTKWGTPFSEDENRELVFHGSQGDKTVTFLHADDYIREYYYGDRFIFFQVPTFQGSRVWFFLPDEGVTLTEMMADEAFRAFLEEPDPGHYYGEENGQTVFVSYKGTSTAAARINLSIPKLDFSCTQDLGDSLTNLGIRSVQDPKKADLSPLLGGKGAYLQQMTQSSRLIMDEEGVSAASYVDYLVGAALPPDEEIDLVVDRPYFFLITGPDNVPLFAGVVNDP
ncbi:MAG: hypothetical protein J5493_00965 [Lachnospiraceae bacterium]|nr:hypothetical protein [Lachnospiraceae bacterium]